MTKISAVLPDDLHARLDDLARENDRSLSAEVRRAIAAHLRRLAVPSGSRGARAEPAAPVAGSGVQGRS